MILSRLTLFYDFIQVLQSIRKHPTKNEYFPMYTLFTTFYLLQDQKLNPRHYYEQELNTRNFAYATDHDVHMYAKFGGLKFYLFL
jgi:hypothetical protein